MSVPRADHRRRLAVFAGLGALAVALVAWALFHKPAEKKPAPHPIPVTAAKAASQDFQLTVTAIGAAQAWTSDLIFAQVSGKLIRVNFKEGSEVKAGQVLAEVDPRPFQAALMQAEGTLMRDEASLAGARRDLVRYQHLKDEGGVSRQVLEDQEATVGQDQGTVEIDRGAVAAAKLNLEFCRIVSPVSGRTGVRLVDPGNLVSASGSANSAASASASAGQTSGSGSSGATAIVIVNQIQPIAVTFSAPQGELQRLSDASGGFSRPLQVQAVSQETGALLDTGELRIADNRVDQNTGTVQFKASFSNPHRSLWPGQFVNVRLGVQTLPNATVIPLSAVNRGPKGQYAFVIGPDHKVSMQPLALVTTQGQLAVVKSGVKPGDIVVTDGQMVLSQGSSVKVARLVAAGGSTP